MGVSMFDWIETSPGRVDPHTGKLVESTSVSQDKAKSMFDWVATSPGRVDPRTGKFIRSSAVREGASGPDLEVKRPQRPTPLVSKPSDDEGSEPGETPAPPWRSSRGGVLDWTPGGESRMNGPISSPENPQGHSNVLFWMVLGFAGFLALEATGVTKLTSISRQVSA